MSLPLIPVTNPTQNELLNRRLQAFSPAPLFRAAVKSWAYYRLCAYDPQYGLPNNPYLDWDEDLDGKRPGVMPTGRIIIDSGAEFLFSNRPRFTVPKNAELEKLVTRILDNNDIDVKLLPLARQCANEGSVWAKFVWTPENKSRSVAISFHSPWEVTVERDPLDTDIVKSLRLRMKYQNEMTLEWFLYQETWTADEYVTYKPLRTNEYDDTKILDQFVDSKWPVDETVPNRMKLIPFVQIYNQRIGTATDGVGDLWDIYHLNDKVSHTFFLEDRSNQWDGDPITAIFDATGAVNNLTPGDLLELESRGEKEARIERLVPENSLREWMQKYADDVERMALDAVGADRINPAEITNKGNLTRQVLELIFHRSVRSTLEKRGNWGRCGLGRFLEKILVALSRMPDARKKYPALAGVDEDDELSFQCVIAWSPMFEITQDERTALLTDLVTAINANLLTWERAIEIAANLFGITDVATLKQELETQQAEMEAKNDERFARQNPPPDTATAR